MSWGRVCCVSLTVVAERAGRPSPGVAGAPAPPATNQPADAERGHVEGGSVPVARVDDMCVWNIYSEPIYSALLKKKPPQSCGCVHRSSLDRHKANTNTKAQLTSIFKDIISGHMLYTTHRQKHCTYIAQHIARNCLIIEHTQHIGGARRSLVQQNVSKQ